MTETDPEPVVPVPAPERTAEPSAPVSSAPETSAKDAPVSDEAIAPDPQAGARRTGLFVFAGLTALGSLFGAISASGLWEPYELTVADLARRIAVTLLGGKS